MKQYLQPNYLLYNKDIMKLYIKPNCLLYNKEIIEQYIQPNYLLNNKAQAASELQFKGVTSSHNHM